MPDDVRSSPQSGTRLRRGTRVGRTARRKPRRSFVPAEGWSENATAFADSSDRLVRRLFDVGLRLHKLRMVFDRRDPSDTELRATSDAIGEMLDDLDGLIRETGLTMLELARDQHTITPDQTDTQHTEAHHGRPVSRRGRLR
ncbi:hypothetical protein OG874_03265 [Nocardia sp. NBC_00565]|uniref:hypothetical protein n=1 Tax=Nocardia sp. NBC_00565 TaxID=2975993 RepID=UPI002E80D49E|nr:hypothetical protein [Nocardia sp. NBC_00565]WUC04242.1 hypothetical protein OG874_03265 [Nocardia sp. NBC_00565]